VAAVLWYLRFNLSYRDVAELLLERGVEVDHVSIYRWVHRFTVKVNGIWRLRLPAIDEYGQVIDVLVSPRRDGQSARRFFRQALATCEDSAPTRPRR